MCRDAAFVHQISVKGVHLPPRFAEELRSGVFSENLTTIPDDPDAFAALFGLNFYERETASGCIEVVGRRGAPAPGKEFKGPVGQRFRRVVRKGSSWLPVEGS